MAEQAIIPEPAKATKETKKEEVTIKSSNYSSGNKWKCALCGISNDISAWRCCACYCTMKESMKKENASIRKQENKIKRDKAREARDAKREAKRQELESKFKKNDDEKNQESASKPVEKSAEVPKVKAEKPPKPAYKLSDGIPKTMRALVLEKGGFSLKTDFAVSMPKEDELLIRSFAVSISAEDSAIPKTGKLGYIPGSDCCGLVVGVGKDCRFRIGDRVVVTNTFDDDEEETFGHGKGTIYGGCCDYYVAKEKYCYRLKEKFGLDWAQGTMLEKLSFALNACERTDLNGSAKADKETVLVSGCGVIGCFVIAVAKTMGVCGKVIACDVDERNLAIAQSMGADEVFCVKTLKGSLKEKVQSLTDGNGVGRAIECSNNADIMSQIFGCVKKGGKVTLTGSPSQKLVINDVFADVISKNIQIRSVYGRRTFKTWNKAERMVSDKVVNFDSIISAKMNISDWEKGFDATSSGKALKIVFDMTK